MYLTIFVLVEWTDDHFWSWFDANRSTFDDNMREKRFLNFRFQRP